MVESSAAFARIRPDIEISWDRRSLRQFGEAPIERYSDDYDFIVMDHPFVGHAKAAGLALDLNRLVPDLVGITMRDQVGRSAESYHFGGGVWGFPTDAAAEIAVYRPDLMDRFNVAVPENHDDVLAAADRLKSRGCSIAVPACPTDAMCLVMSYSANLGEPLGTRAGDYVSVPMLRAVLDLIRHLVSISHPASTTINPIGLHDQMCAGDEIAYRLSPSATPTIPVSGAVRS